LGLSLARILTSCFFAGILLFTSISIKAKTTANSLEKPLRIAVASNFAPTLRKLLASGNKHQQDFSAPVLVVASSGTLFLQAQHGAAFDVFLSADIERPQLLAEAGLAVDDSQKTYAYGQLALWSASPKTELFSENLMTTLNNNQQRLAIANPKIAPYGKAAKEALTSLQLWPKYQQHLIQGINIGQTFQQVRSQAVKLGVVSNSQLVLNNFKGVLIPQRLHRPIEQQLVILKSSKKMAQAKRFVKYLLSAKSQQFFVESGYAQLGEIGTDE